jgi:hypothetical protein
MCALPDVAVAEVSSSQITWILIVMEAIVVVCHGLVSKK